jgi:hypothetical protein
LEILAKKRGTGFFFGVRKFVRGKKEGESPDPIYIVLLLVAELILSI